MDQGFVKRRIGLISPSGGNLGDAAIMTATIANIQKRIAGAEFLGITLNPEDTRRRHRIPAIPLSGLSLHGYGVHNSYGPRTEPQKERNQGGLKQGLKKFPRLFNLLRAILNVFRLAKREAVHIAIAGATVRKLDRIVIPGGGALDEFWGGPWGHPWTLFKWALLCRLFGVPLLFVSVGKSSLERPLSRLFVGIALRLAQYRSYRDCESKRGVQNLLDARNDPVYPDLAFSYPWKAPRASDDGAPAGGRLVVGVSPIAYCDPRVWPYKDERRYAAHLNQMAEMVSWLLGEGHRVFFFATDGPDVETIEDIFEILSKDGISRTAIETLPSPVETSTRDLLRKTARADVIIASRLHGVILSHLNMVPTLALSYDPKVDAYMKAIGQMDYCLDIDGASSERIVDGFRALRELRQEVRAHIGSEILRFRGLLESQYGNLFGPVQNPESIAVYEDRFDAGVFSMEGGVAGE